jgi:hypothetical protein
MKLRRPVTQGASAITVPPHSMPTLLDRLHEWRAAIIFSLAALLFVTGRYIVVPAWRTQDTNGVPELTGAATILSKSTIPGKYSTGWFVTFRVGDRATTMQVNDIEKWTLTNQGDTVPAWYRIGKSGTLYVDDWESAKQSLH